MRWSRVDLWSTRVASGSGMGPPLLKVSYTVRTGPQKRKICEPSLLCRALIGQTLVDTGYGIMLSWLPAKHSRRCAEIKWAGASKNYRRWRRIALLNGADPVVVAAT